MMTGQLKQLAAEQEIDAMRSVLLGLVTIGLFSVHTSATARETPWEQVLAPERPQLPAPQASVRWRLDLADALREARVQGRLLFVTMRCLPCKQCSAFDKNVLEGGPELDPLLRQFITVRLTDAQAIDFRIFPAEGFQDFDLSWWGWFLSPDGKVYGVFGGRDEVSDETRISVPALAATLQRVLAHHYDPRRSDWDVDGPAPDLSGAPKTPKDQPGYASWIGRAGQEAKKQACVHCHQVGEILRQPAIDMKTFDKRRDLEIWPLPENVGLTVDRDHGLRVTKVTRGSPAEKAGVRAGDELGAAGGRRLFSQADLRAALHRGPRAAGAIDVAWLRDGKVHSGALRVEGGWRRTVLDWRMSVSQGNVGADPTSFFPLPLNTGRRKARGIADGTMAVEPYMADKPSGRAYEAGLRRDDAITAVDGQSPDVAGRAFLVWFRMNHEPGDEVRLTVKDPQGRPRDITYRTNKPGE